jgi:uncharacterized membrane protein YdcZ (DUF606 family)
MMLGVPMMMHRRVPMIETIAPVIWWSWVGGVVLMAYARCAWIMVRIQSLHADLDAGTWRQHHHDVVTPRTWMIHLRAWAFIVSASACAFLFAGSPAMHDGATYMTELAVLMALCIMLLSSFAFTYLVEQSEIAYPWNRIDATCVMVTGIMVVVS